MKNIQEIFKDFDRHLMIDDKPSNYLEKMAEEGLFKKVYPFILLGNLMEIPQSPKYHPEGSVWKHTMLVVDNAAKRKHLSKDPKVFMWSALLHDLGKVPTTKIRKGRITSYNHDKAGEALAINFLKQFTEDIDFIKKVAAMVKWHMQPLFVTKNLPFANIKQMNLEVSIDEIALLSLCDRLGRGNMSLEKSIEEKENIEYFIKKCEEVLKKELIMR